MARDAIHELETTTARFLAGRLEGDSSWDYYEAVEARSRVWDDSHDPSFGPTPPNALPATLKRRAEDRAKLSAASRVRDRSEVDLCHGTGKYLGVACPGCRECGEGNGR